jgi:hypothetical protein
MSQGQARDDRDVPGVSHARTPQDPTQEHIREEMGRVLASHEFRTSKRSQDFLKYVVENTLKGHADMLKERTIGIEVFGRSTSYDPSDDATVRVKAGEVRKRLGLYYSTEGAHNPVRIEMPSGTYVPEFRSVASEPPPLPIAPPAMLAQAAATVAVPARPWFTLRRGALAVLVLAAAAALAWFAARPAVTTVDQFWSPVITGSTPVLVCAAFVPVWGRERDADPTLPVRADDFVKLNDQFVGGGDLIATSRLTAMLTRLHRPYRLKVGADAFADLRAGPAVLVGYSYTRWKEISSQMRYFIKDSATFVGITDNGRETEWSLPHLPRDRHTAEDYAIVSRVFHPDTHAMLVEMAGITQYGTDAASDLVTNPDFMAEAMASEPGWQHKNLQLVLRVKVISGAPASPKIVARHFW